MLPLALLVALLLVPAAAAQDAAEIYAEDCISCHGPDGAGVSGTGPGRGAGGVQGAGPSLHGAGAASVDFYLSTGRMPLEEPEEPPSRGEPAYSPEEIDALVAYVTSLGGGAGPPIPEPRPERGDLANGLKLFTDYCAGCHQIVGEGGNVVGARAPALHDATPVQIAEAVRVGPQVMPPFDEETIGDRELDDLVRYVLWSRDPPDEGGWGIGHIGPIPEGAVAWLVGLAVLVALAVAIGERARP